MTSSQQIGFNVRLNTSQVISKRGLTKIGPWNTRTASFGLFRSGITFDASQSSAIAPRSGIYFVSVSIRLSRYSASNRYECVVKTSLSDRGLAFVSENLEDGELCVSGSLRLGINEHVQVVLFSNQTGCSVERNSSFSLQFYGYHGLLPSFLASPVSTSPVGTTRHKQNNPNRITHWKTYHESTTGFSTVNGDFVAGTSASYLCSLLLVLTDLIGTVQVKFHKKTDDIIFSLEKDFAATKSATIHVTRMFDLLSKESLGLTVQAKFGGRVSVSRKTTYSCVLADAKNKSIILQLKESKILQVPGSGFSELAFWTKYKLDQKSDFVFYKAEGGKIFFKESIALVCLSFTVTSAQSGIMTIVLVPGGVLNGITDDQGIVKTLKLRKGSAKTLTVTGVLQVTGDSYVSAFVKTKPEMSLNFTRAEYEIVLRQPLVSSILLPLNKAASSSISSDEPGNSWKSVYINIQINQHPFKTQSDHWSITERYFAPKEYGIYFISVNLVVEPGEQNLTQSDTIEAKILSTVRDENRELQYAIYGITQGLNTVSLTGVFMLHTNEKLSVLYKCSDQVSCEALATSGLSAVLLARTFRMEGFSTPLSESQTSLTSDKNPIGGWRNSKAGFMLTVNFNAETGVYRAAYEGVYLISCSIIIRNVTIDDSLKLRVRAGNAEAHSLEDTGQKSFIKDGEMGVVLGICSCLSLKKNESVSLILTSELEDILQLDPRSSFSIVMIAQPGLAPPFGFTMSLMRNNLMNRGNSLILDSWTKDKLNGAFRTPDNSYFQFKENRGLITIVQSAMLLLSVILRAKSTDQRSLTLSLRVNDKNQGLKSISTFLPGNDKALKLSVALFVKAGERLSVEIKSEGQRANSYCQILDNSVLSAVFLPEAPKKPGMTLWIMGHRTTRSGNLHIFHRKFFLILSCYHLKRIKK